MRHAEKEEKQQAFRAAAAKAFRAEMAASAPSETEAIKGLVEFYLKSLKPASAHAMKSGLNLVALAFSEGNCSLWSFPWPQLDQQRLLLIQRVLRDHYALGTVSKLMTGIRGLMRTAYQMGWIDAEEYLRRTTETQVKVEPLQRGRFLGESEIRSLLEVCRAEQTPIGKRDAAIFAVMLSGGLSVAEVIALSRGDYDEQKGIVRIRYQAERQVENLERGSVYQRKRKEYGHKRRNVLLGPRAQTEINSWLQVRAAKLPPEQQETALFCAVNKWEELTPQNLSRQAINDLLKKRVAQADVPIFTPNDLRKSYLHNLFSRGYDESYIRDLAGYAKSQTVGYYRPGEKTNNEVKQEQVEIPVVDLPEMK
jgi:site-specific recombinase XerD